MESLVASYQRKLIAEMPQVNSYASRLVELNGWWDKVALIGKINSYSLAANILEDMSVTKTKFTELHSSLIENLLTEHLKKVLDDSKSKSQVAIDILIRNLFERTADVGFLATDNDLRQFLQADSPSEMQPSIEDRLNEYVKKYSVYDEIIVLDLDGNVKAHLDQNNPISHSNDPLIAATLTGKADYLETFRYSDLQPNNTYSLLYSAPITKDHSSGSPQIGVLCLCFRFDDELSSIFTNLLQDDHGILLLLDTQNHIIASSNKDIIPLNAGFTFSERPRLINYQSQEYLVTCTKTRGYQGYSGLGWWSMMMTPIQRAFSTEAPVGYEDSAHIASQQRMFSGVLKTIHKSSIDVNDDLRLVVLNGKITAARQHAVEFMPVLEEIKKIGEDTADVFKESISNLQATIESAKINDVRFMAALAVDIMDRNLYERANDCRWWALTSAFRTLLNKANQGIALNTEEKDHISQILSYINELYTVYTNLFLFDSNGQILGVSEANEQELVGQQINAASNTKAVFSIDNSQQYVVSDFVPTPYYAQRPTYIYQAAIKDPDNTGIVGGIGIVFDSEPEFTAMLDEVLPQNDTAQAVEGCFALFVDRTGTVIASSTHAPLQAKAKIELGQELLTLKNGSQHGGYFTHNGLEYMLGLAVSSGYREYKTTNDYKNDVLACVFIPAL